MSVNKKKIVIGVAGASGSIYAKVLFDKLLSIKNQWKKIGVVFSKNAKVNWELEIGAWQPEKYADFDFYEKNDFFAPFASGSAQYSDMIIVPCSAGTLARIANGFSDDLLTRSADVILKERRKLVCVFRETPLSLIHINNMKAVTEAGGIICPAIPSFYSNPKDTEAIVSTVVDRVLDLIGLELDTYRWSE